MRSIMMVEEMGGYIELDTFNMPLLHDGAIALNCGRNAVAYICGAKKIQKLYIPKFLCASVSKLCTRIGIRYESYPINNGFLPVFTKKLGPHEYLYIVNYYGQLSNNVIMKLKEEYGGRIIVDNTQSYFQMPVSGVDTLYSCRKYFGVADGAFLYTDVEIERTFPVDESFERMHFLLGRFERTANEFYDEYVENEAFFENQPVKYMSRLTKNLLRGMDYDFVAERRKNNFNILHQQFQRVNELKLVVPTGPFMYPLLIKNGGMMRKILQKEKIYIPCLWPDVLELCDSNTLEYRYAQNILPLPIDQRYDMKDMQYMIQVIEAYMDER